MSETTEQRVTGRPKVRVLPSAFNPASPTDLEMSAGFDLSDDLAYGPAFLDDDDCRMGFYAAPDGADARRLFLHGADVVVAFDWGAGFVGHWMRVALVELDRRGIPTLRVRAGLHEPLESPGSADEARRVREAQRELRQEWDEILSGAQSVDVDADSSQPTP